MSSLPSKRKPAAKLERVSQHAQRGWNLVTIAGGVLFALWVGYDWLSGQTADKDKMDKEIAPAVAESMEQTKALKSVVKLLREDKLVQQKAMEEQCSKPRSDLPKSYCDQVLAEKRQREAREEEE